MAEFPMESLLSVLDFEKDMIGDTWRRSFLGGVELRVDCANKKFLYEEAGITVTMATTSNFSKPENFVVFECVCRLLEKGYKPKDLELEPAWRFGHNDKAARADIWVRTTDKSGKHSLLIIECKTPGREFESAWRDTCEDGGQLFSYFHQERATQFLCLYTSNLIDDKEVKCDYYLINVQDNEEYLKTLDKPKTYAKASNAKGLFAVWRDTYRLDAATVGLFEPDIAAYKPGKNKYSLDDLSEIDHASMQRKYNEFATILRQHNVSGRENAFDKLVNLFLAKVVDESRNGGELMFYWKGIAYDSPFDLQDRLESLYSIGMKEFLGETVTYIREADIRKAFKRFEKDPDATKDAVLDYFRRLKFYTNNDFSFIDVHNERLFLENAAILLKIVQMLEDIRLVTDEPNQFLGDLFEGFLDNGVKQSEGQFFTPLPVVRFIVSSLPLQEMIRNMPVPPKVIDYSCGAGHFLNEYAQQIKPFINIYHRGNDKAFFSAITGVEKEYRLSKVAKVAAFMYGEDEIKIVYADALVNSPDMPEESFDILIANPPYSVKGFLETLPENDRARYDLTERVSDTSKNNSIETFFVERAAQLLKPCGIAGIILPASILSNGDGVYTRCREIILENFDIIAIAEFASGTFEMTGTNTITLFLRKKDAPPDFADHWRNRVKAWFESKHDGDEVFNDADALERYCAKRGFDLEEYKLFLGRTLPPSSELWNTSAFKAYRETFAKKNAKKKGTDVQDFIRAQERDRLYYFLLADSNPVPVLLVKMPTETKAAKAFLGYEWSRAKGNEGIKYLGSATSTTAEEDTLSRNRGIKSINTPLFDNSRLDNEDAPKLNSLIRKNFRGILTDIPEELKPFTRRVLLTDMLDFDAVTFDKQIKTSAAERVMVSSNFQFVRLGDVAPYVTERTDYSKIDPSAYISTENMLPKCNGVIPYEGTPNVDSIISFRKGDILVSNIRPYLKKLWLADRDGGCSPDVLVFRIRETPLTSPDKGNETNEPISCIPEYLAQLLCRNDFFEFMMNGVKGMKMPRGNKDDIPKYGIPLPPLSVQQAVAEECAAADADYAKAKKTIEDAKVKIAALFDEAQTKAVCTYKLSDDSKFSLQIGRRVLGTEVSPDYDIPVYSANVRMPFGRINKLLKTLTDFSVDSVLWGIDGDWMVNCIKKDKPFYPTDHCGVLRVDESFAVAEFVAFALYKAGKLAGFDRAHRASTDRVTALSINLPSLEEQKKVVAAVEALEAEIAAAKEVMSACPARKREILRKHGVLL